MVMDWELAFTFATRDQQVPFSLKLEHRWNARITGIFGDSGCGKSTLLEVLLGLKPKELVRGNARCQGRTLFDSSQRLWLPSRARGCAWVPQDAALLPHLSAEANLRLTARRGADEAAVVAATGLGALLGKRPAQLSGGERQRVALARALLSPHAALLLDEPLAALDRARRAAFLQLLRDCLRPATTPALYVSHDWGEIEALCDYVLILEAGVLRWAGSPGLWSFAKNAPLS